MPYRTLDRGKITATAEALQLRITERFGDSSLARVAGEVAELTGSLGAHAEKLAAPLWWLRLVQFAFIMACIYLFSQIGTFVQITSITGDVSNVVQGLEAAINTVIFVSVGAYSFATIERRIKRSDALRNLHSLRSVIHIIDMHQLTKDPATLADGYTATRHSPARHLTPNELARYLDYCSELLSITGKIAALYAQALDDDVVVSAVNDIETLSTNLSRKVWQKIMLIEDM